MTKSVGKRFKTVIATELQTTGFGKGIQVLYREKVKFGESAPCEEKTHSAITLTQ